MDKRHLMLTGVVLAICVVFLALVLASCNSSSATTTAAPTSSSPSVSQTTGGAIDAAALYSQNCSGCHKNVPGASAAQVQSVMESGKGSMPSFTDKLTADEFSALVAYVAAGGK